MADGLSSQFSIIDELLSKMNVSVFALDGYEADDLIGTIAHKVAGNGIEVIIVTGDRDLLQLVNKHTKVLMPIVGLTRTILLDEQAVEEKYGVTPQQFVDYKALIGDQSDGYPGVTGIGPKTASNLLKEYETFENLYEKIDTLPEKIGVKLATDAEQASLAKKLARIVTDAPIQFDYMKCAVADFDLVALRDAFAAHNFKSLITRLEARNPDLIKQKNGEKNPSKSSGQEKDDEQLGLL
jgi:DNA polymerase-1